MHDYVLGFVCFMAGGFFAIAAGFISLGRIPLGRQSEERPDLAHRPTDPPPVDAEQSPQREPQRPPRRKEWPPWRGPEYRPWHEPGPHPVWPECDCPTEAFHTKYYPSAGVR